MSDHTKDEIAAMTKVVDETMRRFHAAIDNDESCSLCVRLALLQAVARDFLAVCLAAEIHHGATSPHHAAAEGLTAAMRAVHQNALAGLMETPIPRVVH